MKRESIVCRRVADNNARLLFRDSFRFRFLNVVYPKESI